MENALGAGRYELLSGDALPRSLSARITVGRAPRHGPRRGIRIARNVVGLVGTVASIVGTGIAIWVLASPSSHQPAPLTGELNIAVMPFRARSVNVGDIQPVATALSQTVAESLNRNLANLDPNVVADVNALPGGPLPGADLAQQSSSAATLAAKVNADAVVFGDVSATPAGTVVTPFVYVSSRKLLRVNELGGVYPFGDAIRLPLALGASAPATGELRRTIADRGRGLAEFVAIACLPRPA